MPRVTWPLLDQQPMVEIVLTQTDGQQVRRHLLADTGAGTAQDLEDLILAEADCVASGGFQINPVLLGGAYTGSYPVYVLRIQLPALSFDEDLAVIAVPTCPDGFEGIASFVFLNRFGYGNFGNPTQFGLETP
jgi:hypothetical protein